MNPTLKKALAGAISGFLGAFIADLDAFKKSPDVFDEFKTFDWKIAANRYVRGIVLGVAGAFGLGGIVGDLA
jgi:hypothetical protein